MTNKGKDIAKRIAYRSAFLIAVIGAVGLAVNGRAPTASGIGAVVALNTVFELAETYIPQPAACVLVLAMVAVAIFAGAM